MPTRLELLKARVGSSLSLADNGGDGEDPRVSDVVAPSGPPGRLTIDLGALADNWRKLAARAAPGRCAAVVKADAYGIGLSEAVPALWAAGAGTLVGLALTWSWKLQPSEAQDLTPSMRWRAPSFLNRVADDRGPVLAIAEYRIDPKDSAAFLAVMQDISLERRRDGAYAWHMFEDASEEGKMIETYLIHSVLELKYRQARVTVADEMMEEQASQFLKAPADTRYLVAPERDPRRSRRRSLVHAKLRSRA